MSRLEEIKARLSAAIPVPWDVRHDVWCVSVEIPSSPRGYPDSAPTARFVASAPEDVAYLVGLVERLRNALAKSSSAPGSACPCDTCALLKEAGL